MDPVMARYPFLEVAREAVAEDAPPIEDLVATGDRSAALARAIERIERAIAGSTTGTPHRDLEVEVLSYPLARILVSILDDARVTDRWVRAEARTAIERLRGDLDRDAPPTAGLDLPAVLAEFDLEVDRDDGRVSVALGDYLPLATSVDGDDWRLVNRAVDTGRIELTEEELLVLVEAAIRRRVGEGVPLEVPEGLVESLSAAVDGLEAAVGRRRLPDAFDGIDPALFPPCIRALIGRIEADEPMAAHSRYAVASFLTSIGLGADDLEAVIETEIPPSLRTMAERISGADGPTQFPPGTCATMVVLGDCIDPDALCAEIDHPLEYYDERLHASGTD